MTDPLKAKQTMTLVVDGNGLVHILYHITESKDPPDVVERFLNRLEYLHEWAGRLAKKIGQELRLVCVFDSPGRTFRSDLIAEYKAQRTHDLLVYECVNHAKEAVSHSADWECQESPEDFEADDLIASIAHQSTDPVVIHSADKDFNQCLVNGRVGIIKKSGVIDSAKSTLGSISVPIPQLQVKRYTYRDFVHDFGFTPDRWVDYQCLIGDSADNVKGAFQIGPVKAKEIILSGQIEEYDIENLNKRQQQGWDSFLENLNTLRRVFTLQNNLEVACHS